MRSEIWERFDYLKMAKEVRTEITAIEKRIGEIGKDDFPGTNAAARLYALEDELCELKITEKLLLRKARASRGEEEHL